MTPDDERARDRLVAAAQEARREAARSKQVADDALERNASLTKRIDEQRDRHDKELRELRAQLESSERQVQLARSEAAEQLAVATGKMTEKSERQAKQIGTLKKQLAKAVRDKEIYRDRLQAQYDRRWTRLGAELRTVKQRPWRLAVLPIRLAKVAAGRTGGAERGSVTPVERSSGRGRSDAPVPAPADPRFDGVIGRDPRPVLSILDEFTHSCLAPELQLVPADRTAPGEQVASASLLLAESAWRGNDATWSYQFNKFTPGNDLDSLLADARAAGVTTAIWNKEDPVNYDLFLPVMRRFDYVFTTDADIVERYRSDLGHDRVAAMAFAAQPLLHNPIGRPTGPLTSICFAGAWRGKKYPGRAERLTTLLGAAKQAGELVIYDREPAQYEQGEGFPEQFHQHIRGTLSYREMIDEYRRHACFLNVNTVEDSSTMMSRRVFEILACRTPVVSTPSAAIERMLGDVVLTPSGRTATNDAIERIVDDIDHRDRLGQLGYRTVMGSHTYQHRVAEAFDALGRPGFPPPDEPSIDVICVSARPEYLRQALDNYRRQSYPNARLVFVTNSDDFDRGAVESAVAEFDRAVVLHMPPDLTLGECLNAALEVSDAEFFAKFDDDDRYGAHYLSDMVLATRFAHASVYGKRTFHAHVESIDSTVVRHEGHEFRYSSLVMGGTLLVRRRDIGDLRFEAVVRGTDTRFLRSCSERGLRIFSTDRFNYLMTRRATAAHHTWQITDDEFMSTSRRLGPGLLLDDVLI